MFMVILFLAFFVTILVFPALRAAQVRSPLLVAVGIAAVIMVGFLLAPGESQPVVNAFAQAAQR